MQARKVKKQEILHSYVFFPLVPLHSITMQQEADKNSRHRRNGNKENVAQTSLACTFCFPMTEREKMHACV